MSTDTMRLDRLTEVDPRYAYYHEDGVDGGDLLWENESGNMLISCADGQWTSLEAVASREEAVEAAKEWENAR